MRLYLTNHARTRMAQRGFQHADLHTVVESGTVMRPGRHVLRSADVDRELRNGNRRIKDLERLRGAAVIVNKRAVITCFRIRREARGTCP